MSSKTEFPRLDHAPIVEAVFDIQARLDPDVVAEEVEKSATERLKVDYPEVKRQLVQQHKLERREDTRPKHEITEGLRGFQFRSQDQKQIVQVRRDGFSFNRLAPYGSFDDYLPEVQRRWAIYCEIGKPVEVTRIALRYINRIELTTEGGRIELDDYLRIGPRVPNERDVLIAGFLNQLQIAEPKSDLKANVTTTVQFPSKGTVALILDIDAYQEGRFEPDSTEIWALFQDLRGLKNRIFFGSITNKCLSLLK